MAHTSSIGRSWGQQGGSAPWGRRDTLPFQKFLGLPDVVTWSQVRPEEYVLSIVFRVDTRHQPLFHALLAVRFYFQGTSTSTKIRFWDTTRANGEPKHYFLLKLALSQETNLLQYFSDATWCVETLVSRCIIICKLEVILVIHNDILLFVGGHQLTCQSSEPLCLRFDLFLG